MRSTGGELLARWRETGEWWTGESTREYARYIDAKGVRRERSKALSYQYLPSRTVLPEETDQSEEWSLRARRARDDKMRLAYLSYRQADGELAPANPEPVWRMSSAPYCPLHVLSGYSFGRGVMLPEEMARCAASVGLPGIAIADSFSLTGAYELTKNCRKVGIKPLVGATLELETGGEIVLLARTREGYKTLSQLVSACHVEEPRLYPLATWERLGRFRGELICLTGGTLGPVGLPVIDRRFVEAKQVLERLGALYGREHTYVEIERAYMPWEVSANPRLQELAAELGMRCVASGPTLFARRSHFPAQDLIACAHTLCTVDDVTGRKAQREANQTPGPNLPTRELNAERFLKTGEEMAKLYSDAPELLANTLRVMDSCDSDVMPERTRLPRLYEDPEHALREIVWAGAHLRYPKISHRLHARIEHELERIQRLEFSGHFLTAWDACRWAGDQEILFSGRGSVVDSVVAYCLGFSRIDAYRHRLHFDRFLPADGSKRPDIDIDFEAHRRDDVRNYLIRKYGSEHVATVAAVGSYCTRGIVREVGKAFGIPDSVISFLSKRLHGGVSPERLEAALQGRPELRGSDIPKERFQWVFALAERLRDVPRNMRANSSGVIISARPLSETVPVMWSAALDDEDTHLRIVQWDKRSCKPFFDKFDILCLRGQDALSGAQRRIRVHDKDFRVESISLEDKETYAAMRSGELIGIPQSASPAMRQAHVRLKTENLDEASLIQAGIRPGVGGAVKLNEMIARRHGKPYSFSHPLFETVLGHTYGIIVFQEQVDQLLQLFAGYSSGEAEEIREAIHEGRRDDYGNSRKAEIVERIVGRGFSEGIADEAYELIANFKGYGFAQGHALAFAEISVRSVYCQQNYPAEFFASILDAQPAGYYGPCTLVNEARSRGVAILPLDANLSEDSFLVEDVRSKMDPQIVFPSGGIRVSLKQLSGLSQTTRERILALRPFASVFDFAAKVKPDRDELESLILAGALDSLHPNRRKLLWAIPSLQDHALASRSEWSLPFEEPEPALPGGIRDFNAVEKAFHERRLLDVDVEHHLMGFERARISERGGISAAEAKRLPHGRKAIVVGNPIRLRFPPTPSGKRVVFFDLEDETGLLNVTVFDAVYQQDGHSIVCSPYVTIIGESQDRGGHIAFLAKRVFPYRPDAVRFLGSDEAPASGHPDMGWGRAPLPIVTGDFLMK